MAATNGHYELTKSQLIIVWITYYFFYDNLKFVECRKAVFVENIHFAVCLTQPTGMATLLTSLPPASPCHGVSVAVRKGWERKERMEILCTSKDRRGWNHERVTEDFDLCVVK